MILGIATSILIVNRCLKATTMQVQYAEVSDIQRSIQRDNAFVDELQEDFISILKLFGNNAYNSYRNFIPVIATSWYYFTTSVSNRQTLGEEYAGILRAVSKLQIPSKLVSIRNLL